MKTTNNRLFPTKQSAKDHLTTVALKKGLVQYQIDEGVDKNQEDIMVLIELDSDGLPEKIVDSVFV